MLSKLTKRVLRIKACILYDVKDWTPEAIIEFLEKNGLYALMIIADMSLKETPPSWQPKQQTLNHTLKSE